MAKGNTNCVSIGKILFCLKEKNFVIFVYWKSSCNLKEGPLKGKFPLKSKGDFWSKGKSFCLFFLLYISKEICLLKEPPLNSKVISDIQKLQSIFL